MRKLLLIIFCLVFFSGCSKLKYIDELLTLKQLGDEQAAMAEQIKANDHRFELLLDAIFSGKIEKHKNKKNVLADFGKPVFSKKVKRSNQELEKWLYRYSTRFFDSPKVNFYFDESGNIVDWEHIEEK